MALRSELDSLAGGIAEGPSRPVGFSMTLDETRVGYDVTISSGGRSASFSVVAEKSEAVERALTDTEFLELIESAQQRWDGARRIDGR